MAKNNHIKNCQPIHMLFLAVSRSDTLNLWGSISFVNFQGDCKCTYIWYYMISYGSIYVHILYHVTVYHYDTHKYGYVSTIKVVPISNFFHEISWWTPWHRRPSASENKMMLPGEPRAISGRGWRREEFWMFWCPLNGNGVRFKVSRVEKMKDLSELCHHDR